MRFLLLALLALCFTPANAQWQTVAYNGNNVTVFAGSYARWGNPADGRFTAVKPFISNQSFSVGGGEFPISPDPTVGKANFVLQIYQQPIAQKVVVNGVTQSVPAASVVTTPPPASSSNTVDLWNCLVSFNVDGSFTSSNPCTKSALPAVE